MEFIVLMKETNVHNKDSTFTFKN